MGLIKLIGIALLIFGLIYGLFIWQPIDWKERGCNKTNPQFYEIRECWCKDPRCYDCHPLYYGFRCDCDDFCDKLKEDYNKTKNGNI